MATTREQIDVSYPIPTYRYRVVVGEDEMAFSSVDGLSLGVETMEYKDGLGNWYQMPGQRQGLSISLSRGVVKGRSELYDWFNSISLNKVEKKDIQISLTDEAAQELYITWNIFDAFPTSLSAPSFNASSNEVAIETLSLTALRMTVEFH